MPILHRIISTIPIRIPLLSNSLRSSLWGISSSVLQNLLYSLFFIVIARVYTRFEFSTYIIVNTLYGMVGSFASMGLGQWFTRELVSTNDQKQLVKRFFGLQLMSGCIFYIFTLLLSFFLYQDHLIRTLSCFIGINIIFDNIIYVIKHINIFQQDQKRTFFIQITEASLKFLTASILLFKKLPLLHLSIILIALRFISLNLFLRYGTPGVFSVLSLVRSQIQVKDVLAVIRKNWVFIIIGGVSVIYWKIGNILVSKFLSFDRVADYEVSYKLFSVAEIIPFIFSSSIFPQLVRSFEQGIEYVRAFYEKYFFVYALFGLSCYTFILSYADDLIPFLFGESYASTALYTGEMFLSMLLYPTLLIQANILVSMKLERIDMWLNVTSLIAYLIISFIGITIYRELSILNYSIFISLILFHLLQDWILIKKEITTLAKVSRSYLLLFTAAGLYYILNKVTGSIFLFPVYWALVLLLWSVLASLGLCKKHLLI